MSVTNGISLGICAIDYRGDDPYLNHNTPGLIVDNVSRSEEPSISLPIRSFDDSLGHARTHGETPSSLDCHFRREPDQ
jgi:hypothetical protein